MESVFLNVNTRVLPVVLPPSVDGNTVTLPEPFAGSMNAAAEVMPSIANTATNPASVEVTE